MRYAAFALIAAPIAALASASLAAPAHADMRAALRASVVEQCAVEALDAERLADGVIAIETRCNAPAYTLRLVADGRAVALDGADSETAEIEIAPGDDGALVRQAAPGVRVIALRLSDPRALSGRLQVRIEVV